MAHGLPRGIRRVSGWDFVAVGSSSSGTVSMIYDWQFEFLELVGAFRCRLALTHYLETHLDLSLGCICHVIEVCISAAFTQHFQIQCFPRIVFGLTIPPPENE